MTAAFVLWAGQAWAQTAVVSPTGAQTLEEGNALSFTVTVNVADDISGFLAIDWRNLTPAASGDDFAVYRQDTRPTSSDTPLTLTEYDGYPTYRDVEVFAAGNAPAAAVTFWFLAETDTVSFEPDETLKVYVNLWRGNTFVAASNTMEVTITDATPLPDPTGKPTTPANLMAAAGKGAVTLTWDAIDDTSSNTNRLNDVQITKHQVRQSTDGDISDETWTDIPNSAPGEANDTSYTIDGLADGTEYTFQVRAVNACDTTAGCGNSDPATAVMSTPDAGALARPAGLTATAGNTTVMLNWDDPNDDTILAYDYQEKAGTQDFGEWTALPPGSLTDHTHRFTGLDNGIPYTYRIRARTSAKTSLASDAATATPQGAVPASIVLTVTPRHSGVTLSWPNPRDPTIEEYEYQYKTGSGIYGLWTEIEEGCVLPGSDFMGAGHLDTGGAMIGAGVGSLTNGQAYTFRVRARNAEGDTISNEVAVMPAVQPPAKPTGLETWVDSGSRFLRWDHPRDRSITAYEYSTDGGRTWNAFPTLRCSDPSELASGEFTSGTHAFRVRAKNANGYSPASDTAISLGGSREIANNVRLEWDSGTGKATLVWDGATNGALKWWYIRFYDNATLQGLYDDPANRQYGLRLRIGVTRLEIAGTVASGDSFTVLILTRLRLRPTRHVGLGFG